MPSSVLKWPMMAMGMFLKSGSCRSSLSRMSQLPGENANLALRRCHRYRFRNPDVDGLGLQFNLGSCQELLPVRLGRPGTKVGEVGCRERQLNVGLNQSVELSARGLKVVRYRN